MTKRFNVGIDVDGVLADFTGAARKTMKQLFGGKPSDDLVQTTWAFESLGISREEECEFWRYVDKALNWWMYLQPMPNAACLSELVHNHRCVFITNRKDGTNPDSWPIEEQTKDWLYLNHGIQGANVIISDKKGPVAEGLKLDYFIDDRPQNVAEVGQSSPNTKEYILRTTYNREFNADREVNSFDEFAKQVLKEGYASNRS